MLSMHIKKCMYKSTYCLFYLNTFFMLSDDEANLAIKSPVKSLKKTKPEKPSPLTLPENKNMFGEQFSIATHQNEELAPDAGLFGKFNNFIYVIKTKTYIIQITR